MIASFRAPIPKADPGMLAAEPIGDILASPLASSYESASAADSQTDVGVNVVPAIIPIPPEEDKGNGTSLLPPSPSADLSGASLDVAGSKTVQDSTPPEGAAQRAPDSPVAASLPVLKKPSVDAEKFEGGVEAALMAAFKRGAELEEWSATSVTPELMETLGRLLRTAAQGAVSLLAARAAIKQEIHLSLTLINPKSNNPLKFLPDGHTALLQMLGTRMPGFMAPVDAMQEAFDDLLIHQTAIAAGTQATIEALFRRFDPGVIESQYLKNGTGERLSQAKLYARLWSAYINQYQLINEEIKDDFFKRLGAEFHHAYDREYGQRAKDER
jgi:FHA domain-containing protein